MNRVCIGVGWVEPVSSWATMSVAIWMSPGLPLTTTLWLAPSKLILAVLVIWPEGARRVSAWVRIWATLVVSYDRGRNTFVSCTVCERTGTLPPTWPWTGLSTRLMSVSICSSWPGMGAATMRRFWVLSTMRRALVAAAAAVSLGAATPGMAWRTTLARSSALITCG